jgi:chemotaxis protein CheZ
MSARTARKRFRIERQGFGGDAGAFDLSAANQAAGPVDGTVAADRHDAVMAAIADLSAKLDGLGAAPAEETAPPAPETPSFDVDAYRQQVLEAETLRRELQELSDAIQRTKEEIVSLRTAPRGKDQIATASEALRAVVSDTENATDGIIQVAESIEEIGGRLSAQNDDPATRELTDALGEQVTQIFEHCNFQDITGQRITKVVQTMEFIDERIARMMEIWGGDEAFAGTVPPEAPAEAPAGEVLDGPSAAPEQKISQDDIDKLFD